jgi:O-succinylbenzoate synthase
VHLDEVELRRIRLPLVTPFRTSSGSITDREILLVKVTTPESEGWGECGALAEPTYTAEYVEGAHHVLRRYLVPALLDAAAAGAGTGTAFTAAGVGPALAFVKGHRMAKASLEMAVLDAGLRARGQSLASFLGGTRKRVEAGVSVGIMGSVAELLDAVAGYVEAGYRRVKLKIEPGWDIEPVGAVRQRFGDGLALQVDGNAAYRLHDTPALAQLDSFGLLLIEQPLPDDDIAGHAELARLIATPICLDESIESAQQAAAAIDAGACAIVNIKAARVGGYLEARRVHDVCAARGVPVWCGGMLETGLGRAANVALASLPNFTLPGDLSASDRYYHEDITPPFVLEDGCLRVPTEPGIGVTPIPETLAAVTSAVERLPARAGPRPARPRSGGSARR